MINSFRDLEVWQKSIGLVKDIYMVTKNFPKEEIYGLTNQMRRSAVSIPSNIAEGKSRNSKSEYIQFLFIALGSIAELETQVIISGELLYIERDKFKYFLEKLDHISRMLRKLIQGLRNSPQTGNR